MEIINKLYRRARSLAGRVVRSFKKPMVFDTDSEAQWGRVFDLRRKVRVKLDGFNLFAMPNDYVGASIIAHQSYEKHVTDVIRAELKEGDVFLDLGANLGYFAMMGCSIVKERGKVISFEPNPQNLQLITASQQDNKFNNLTLYPYAVSDHATTLRFTTVGSNGGVITEHSKYQTHYLMVESVVLDDFLKDEERIDFVKMDIEAHELPALRGMENLMRKFRPKLVTEFHPWAISINNPEPTEELLEKIESFGYRISVIKHGGGLVETNSAKEVIDYWESLNDEKIHLDLYAYPV